MHILRFLKYVCINIPLTYCILLLLLLLLLLQVFGLYEVID